MTRDLKSDINQLVESTVSSPAPRTSRSRLERALEHPLALLFPLLLAGGLASGEFLAGAGLHERDGYFHARYAQRLPQDGLTSQFVWTQASTWNGQFCDKELLFHALLVPFTRDAAEPVHGAGFFQCLLIGAIFGTLFFILKAHGVRAPAFFAALPLCAGPLFLNRLLMLRSHVLSMLLLIIGIHFLIKQRRWALCALGFIYAWSYTVPLVLVITAVPFVLGRRLGASRWDWKSPLAALGGVLAGWTIHPYSPHTWETFLTYVNVIWMGFQGQREATLALGSEVYALSPLQYLYACPGELAAGLLLLGLLLWKKTRSALRPETLGALAAALAWFALSARFARFIEYASPLAALALGLSLRDVCACAESKKVPTENEQPASFWPRSTCCPAVGGVAGALGAGLLFAGLFIYGVTQLKASQQERFNGPPPPARFRGAAAWMNQHLKAGETVVNLYWEDFPELYYDGARQHYIWGLDPTYTLRANREQALQLELLHRQTVPDSRPSNEPARLNGPRLAKLFGARYLVLAAGNALLYYPELKGNPNFPNYPYPQLNVVYADKFALIAQLEE